MGQSGSGHSGRPAHVFFQFLEAGERWREFLADCPPSYAGNRGSGKRDVMGTAMLIILCGHWRCAHINSVRGDRVPKSKDSYATTCARAGDGWIDSASPRPSGSSFVAVYLTAFGCGDGWEAAEAMIKLSGWTRHRGVHREAITSRPALMQGVARQVQSSGQRTIKVSLLHENGAQIAVLVSLTSKQLQRIKLITERWSAEQKWALLFTRLLRRWLGGKWLSGLPPDAALLLTG